MIETLSAVIHEDVWRLEEKHLNAIHTINVLATTLHIHWVYVMSIYPKW